MVDNVISDKPGVKDNIVLELRTIGVCDLCVLRYLGVKDPAIYRNAELSIPNLLGVPVPHKQEDHDVDNGPEPKIRRKKNPCTACLGLLQDCVQDQCLDKIAEDIKNCGIQAASYAPVLSLPMSMMIRAHSIWYHLLQKFPQVYESLRHLKPEGIGVKMVWKWMCSSELKHKVDRTKEWMTDGDLITTMAFHYKEDKEECKALLPLVKQRNRRGDLTRGNADQVFAQIKEDVFRSSFTCPPTLPSYPLEFEKVVCLHMAIFIAGRYCKYSRNVSQSPWLDAQGKRVRGEASVQELISDHVLPMFNCDSLKFSSSGREDSDVRMLGRGRPFVLELINPKKTLFAQDKIKALQQVINQSTKLISVRDLQIVDKKDLKILRDGEEGKSKRYTALCRTSGREVTAEVLQILNDMKMPLILQQITPLRVLHRRSILTRPRGILQMRAEPAKRSNEMFILHLQTEAGTYVKEFVHGDFGRTVPSVSDLLGHPTEILSLDVSEVELDWPPAINND